MMSLDKIVVGIGSLISMIGVYWFFLMKAEEKPVVIHANSVDIMVDGGYSPRVISIPKGQKTTFNFHRRDPSSCLEEVVLPEFRIRKFLPLNQTTSIAITPQQAGEFEIACGMNMFHGKIIVT